MSKKPETLVIVESPSKAKTINKYLGKSYVISSSVGHIIDLPKSRLAIDVDNGFKPEYITIRGKAKILNELKKLAGSVERVLLATDPDREGEAISFHLYNALSVKNPNIKRIEFNEITENAVKEAVAHPRDINTAMVNAQQARRILDRIVGYKISPVLWKKVKRGLSAGRVQSVALKVICDREEQIEGFMPEEYWTLDAECSSEGKKFTASLYSIDGKKAELKNGEETEVLVESIRGEKAVVSEVRAKDRKRNPQPPYITSKLQQDGANRLGFTSQKTMMVAQQLYQGVDIAGEGLVGLITYMRTDSTRVSDVAMKSLREYISSNFDGEYLPDKPNTYRNKKGSQDAHEAIRPSDVHRTPAAVKKDLSRDQFRLYEMIWNRFVSSQMTPEVSEVTTVSVDVGNCQFRASGSRVVFPGFGAVEKPAKQEKSKLPVLSEGDNILIEKFTPEQHFTSPPPRFNDASLIKFLEESGVGRPSTYAPTINTIISRYYVTRTGRQLVPTVLGKLVNRIMLEHFSSFITVDFTAEMEEQLDLIEESESDWVEMLEKFYPPFIKTVHEAENNIEEMKGILDEDTDLVCEKCGSMMKKKLGKYGYFLACSGFPECRNAKPYPLGKCPQCEGDIVKRSSKKGRGTFYSCTNYPECEFLTRDAPVEHSCPKCGKILFSRKIKGKGYELVCYNSQCDYRVELLDDDPGKS